MKQPAPGIGRVFLPLLLSAILPGSPVTAGEAVRGIQNPSIRVLVNEQHPIPRRGTIGWGLSVFRVEPVPGLNVVQVNDRLRAALKAGFARKGFAVAAQDPDLLVSLALAAGASIDEEELNRTYGDMLHMPRAGTNSAGNLAFKPGVLIVDVIDRQAKRLLWRGAIMADIDINLDENLKQERCDGAVRALMEFFPRPPKSHRLEPEPKRKEIP